MPISDRTRGPARPGAVRASWLDLVWPATIVLVAVTVFVLFWQTTLAMGVAMGLATLLTGGILLTVVSGTSWITQLRHLLGGKGR